MEGKWIKFILKEQKPKTQVWSIVAKEDNLELGYIAWFGRWRKYAFFPNNNIVFEPQCLKDIIAFIEKLMQERKADKDFRIGMREVSESASNY